MKIRPLHDRILVQRLEEGEQQIGGIIIPDTAKEKPQQGKVRAVGNGKVNDAGQRVPLDVRAGHRILFGKYAGQDITFDGEEYLILTEEDALAVLEGTTTTKTKKKTKKKTSVGVKGKTEKTRVGFRGKAKKETKKKSRTQTEKKAKTKKR
jgi:chaperonin GroES